MRPKLELLDKPLIERILDEAFQLIEDPGVRVAPYVEELLRSAGITVKDGVAHIRKVSVARDLGTQVEILDGVLQGELVILNPPVDLVDGSKVQAQSRPAAPNA